MTMVTAPFWSGRGTLTARRSFLDSHHDLRVELRVGEECTDEREVGFRRVGDLDGDRLADRGSSADVHSRAWQCPVRDLLSPPWVGIDACGASCFAGRVNHSNLVADDKRDLEDGKEREHQHGQQERELHGRLTALSAVRRLKSVIASRH